ncbi:MAG: hypothetical protein QM308_08010 [Bacillota bacterium]|nr:hypothetical protein [Bacillota bacterium]
MQPDENNLPVNEEQPRKKQGILEKSKGFLQSAVDSISGKDLPKLVEEFTRDMVVIAEGLSEDQAALRGALTLQGEEQDELSERLREQEKKLNELQKKVDALTLRNEKRKKGETGLVYVLRQATWLAAVIGGFWLAVTLVRALVK